MQRVLTEEAVATFLIERIAELVDREPREIDLEKHPAMLGLDSATALLLAGDLEEHFGVELPATITLDHDSLRGIVENVVSATRGK